jgi:hypothetical protein
MKYGPGVLNNTGEDNNVLSGGTRNTTQRLDEGALAEDSKINAKDMADLNFTI